MRKAASLVLIAWLISQMAGFAVSITTPYIFAPNTTIQAGQVNANFSTIAGVVNGNLDNGNISGTANINPSKLNLTTPWLNAASGANVLGFGVGLLGDTVARVGLYGDGSLKMGVGGATAPDIALRRGAANTLQLYIPAGGTPTLDLNTGVLSGVATATITTANITTMAAGATWNGNTITYGYGGTGLTTSGTDSKLALMSDGAAGFHMATPGMAPFGDWSNARPFPVTAGATNVAGDYYSSGNVTAAGTYTMTAPVRIHCGGTFTLSGSITGGTYLPGGIANITQGFMVATSGSGPGGGGGGSVYSTGTGAGAGAGSYGAGGNGSGIIKGSAGQAYSLLECFNGSGGGGGVYYTTNGGAGGGGGTGLYIESIGDILINGNITLAGGAGVAGVGNSDGSGGGGSAPACDLRSQGAITIAGGKTIALPGGAGGAGFYGGGGGSGGLFNAICAGTYTNSGTISYAAGAGGVGSNGTGAAGAGGAKVESGSTTPWRRRTF